jgi:hypothetical protein
LYEQKAGAPVVKDTLIPKLKHEKGGYVQRPSERDFFYVTRRASP